MPRPEIPPDPSLQELLSGPPSLQPEIDTLRRHMARLQSAFEHARARNDRLRLANAWCDASAHLARLLRVQRLLQSAQPDPLAQFMSSLIKEINDEWEAEAAGQPPRTSEEILITAGEAARREIDASTPAFTSLPRRGSKY